MISLSPAKRNPTHRVMNCALFFNLGTEVHKGKVYGRKLGFAVISITASHNVSAAWETVAHCLNHNRPIIIE